MVIALMLESTAPGGAERMVLQLGEELRRRGHEVVPVGPDHRPNWLREQFLDRGFVPETYTLRRPLDVGCLRQLVGILRRRRVSAVHSHEFTMAVYGAAATRLLRRPHVVTIHGGQTSATARWHRRAALRWALRTGRAATVSAAARDQLSGALGLSPSSVRVVHNGISFEQGRRDRVRQELGMAPNEPLILAVGNLYPVKGHIHLLRALALLRSRHPDLAWRAAIAGKVTLQGRVEEEAREFLDFASANGFADRLHLLGFRTDVPDLLSAADIFTMPSLSEGLPLALLEAMFAGKAIVASSVGGIPEALRDGREGLLTRPGDAESVAGALERILRDRPYGETLAGAAAERAATAFGVENMARSYEDLYGRVA